MEPIILRAGIKGNGLFATQCYNPGDLVIHALYSSIHEPVKFINHSCDPNCKMNLVRIVAIKPIDKNEEITMDYETFTFKYKEQAPFDCQCGSKNCHGRLYFPEN